MPHRVDHIFHVVLRCENLTGNLRDFTLPQWSPGYYGMGNYWRNISDFRAEDTAGHSLPWEKVTTNTWRVATDGAPVVILAYDIFANTIFPANSYLGEDRAFLSPAAAFLYPEGELAHPLSLHIDLPRDWKNISTGLDPVPNSPGNFSAASFDILYDSPILLGNHERLRFEVAGVEHDVAIENVPSTVDRAKIIADLKKIVTAATELMGDVPYSHYTFLMMGHGVGGIEHANSSANQFNGDSLTTPEGYLRWLSFISHEYFHNFNVKRIRPLALGPFNYSQENLTRMLWVSEGLSVYYEDLILVRAGLMSRSDYLVKLSAAIGVFENAPGRRYQSATESSWNTWDTGSGVAGDRNTTISYYNNGAMLGAMLDLAIRGKSGNRNSLDDVMRSLYRIYYRQKKRGFTDAEFRATCERAAGGALDEIFSDAATTAEVDYAGYFAIAGLKLDVTTEESPGGFVGLDTDTEEIPPNELTETGRPRNGPPKVRLVVTDFVPGSAAAQSGLRRGDRIVAIDETPATPGALYGAISSKPAGESITLRVRRPEGESNITVVVSHNQKSTFHLSVGSSQNAILRSWLGD